jgi:hypothetical protein
MGGWRRQLLGRHALDLAMASGPTTRSKVILTPSPPLDSSAASVVGALSSAFLFKIAATCIGTFDICPIICQTCGSSAALPVFACYLQASTVQVFSGFLSAPLHLISSRYFIKRLTTTAAAPLFSVILFDPPVQHDSMTASAAPPSICQFFIGRLLDRKSQGTQA